MTLMARIGVATGVQYQERIARLRAEIGDMEREADESERHARQLRDSALRLRGRWSLLVDEWQAVTR